jgi:hypothetical protein
VWSTWLHRNVTPLIPSGNHVIAFTIARLLTKHYIPYLLLQLVSPDSAQELLHHITTLAYPDVSRSEFLFRCPRFQKSRCGWCS